MLFAQSPFKGGFIGDEAGLGKSLTALITAIKLRQKLLPNCGFILIVCPPHCAAQWANEIETHFEPTTRPSYIILRDSNVSVQALLKYDIVICSGQFVMYRYKSLLAHCEYYANRRFNIYAEAQDREDEPQIKGRVSGPLHSRVYDRLGRKIAVLILDESHYARNPAAKVYRAILLLYYHHALLLTATPMLNNRLDMVKQMGLLPGGGPFIDDQHISAVFGLENGNASEPARYSYKALFERLACAITVARPKSVLRHLQKPKINYVVVNEPARWLELAISGYVRKSKQYLGIGKNSRQPSQQDSAADFAMLSIATQLDSNPLILQASSPPMIDAGEIHDSIAATLSKKFPHIANVDALGDAEWQNFKNYCEENLKLPEKLIQLTDDDGLVDDDQPMISDTDTSPGDTGIEMTSFMVDDAGLQELYPLPDEREYPFLGSEQASNDHLGGIPVPLAEELSRGESWENKLSSAEDDEIISTRVHAILECVIAEAIWRELHQLDVVEYNGTVPAEERAKCLERINTPGGLSILFLAADATRVGLNLAGVSHIIIAEPLWNLGLETHIIGRSDRLGQKHRGHVTKLVCEGSAIDNLVGEIREKETVTEPKYGFLVREDDEPFYTDSLSCEEEF
ncbi:unnamed protein product [Clonostachys rosea]|uniref:Helicase ATP-binding domain-containing protein n=1 Tax=Bionectria ochroleuca TaxID=29856 RepID=A0ABY6U0E9_BIOOC|nr:unnamed protein product [Clonostachys rosea]